MKINNYDKNFIKLLNNVKNIIIPLIENINQKEMKKSEKYNIYVLVRSNIYKSKKPSRKIPRVDYTDMY